MLKRIEDARLRCPLCLQNLRKNPFRIELHDPKHKVVCFMFVHRKCGKLWLNTYLIEE